LDTTFQLHYKGYIKNCNTIALVIWRKKSILSLQENDGFAWARNAKLEKRTLMRPLSIPRKNPGSKSKLRIITKIYF